MTELWKPGGAAAGKIVLPNGQPVSDSTPASGEAVGNEQLCERMLNALHETLMDFIALNPKMQVKIELAMQLPAEKNPQMNTIVAALGLFAANYPSSGFWSEPGLAEEIIRRDQQKNKNFAANQVQQPKKEESKQCHVTPVNPPKGGSPRLRARLRKAGETK